MTGDWFSLLAVVALLREVRGSDPAALSGFFILKLLPFFVAGPLAGVLADRFSRKAIMILADLARALLVVGLLAAPLVVHTVEVVYALVLLQVLCSGFFEPARSAAVPQLVPDHHLSAANALGAMMWSVVFAVGAALGGVVTEWFGWRVALAIDAATYIVSALLIARIALPRRARRPRGVPGWRTLTGWRDFAEGLSFIRRHAAIGTVLFVKAGWGVAGAVTLILTLFGERIYTFGGREDLGVSLLFTARAAGTGIGPWLARRLLPDEKPRTLYRLMAVAFAWPAVWYGLFSWTGRVWIAVGCVLLAHLGGSVLWVYSSILLQRRVPDEYRGRVMSTDLGLATLSISISTWVYGMLAARPTADLRVLTRWMAFSLLVPTAIWIVAGRHWFVANKPGSSGGDRSRRRI